jgi:hypothetical protein
MFGILAKSGWQGGRAGQKAATSLMLDRQEGEARPTHRSAGDPSLLVSLDIYIHMYILPRR